MIRCFRPLIHLIVKEHGILVDILDRNTAQTSMKISDLTIALIPVLRSNSLIIVERSKYEPPRRLVNPAFHHVNLKIYGFHYQ
jgi:hypothetical protein